MRVERGVGNPLIATYTREQSLPTIDGGSRYAKSNTRMNAALLKTRRKYNNLIDMTAADEYTGPKTSKAAAF